MLRTVRKALEDQRWRFRTAEGIAEEYELAVDEVRGVLDSDSSIARVSVLRDPHGRRVYAPAKRRLSLREHLARIRWVFTEGLGVDQRGKPLSR